METNEATCLEILTSDEAREREKKLAGIRKQIEKRMIAGLPFDDQLQQYGDTAFYKLKRLA